LTTVHRTPQSKKLLQKFADVERVHRGHAPPHPRGQCNADVAAAHRHITMAREHVLLVADVIASVSA
jgi:hypothetical protein